MQRKIPRQLSSAAALIVITLISAHAWAVGFEYVVENQKSQSGDPHATLVLQATDFVKRGQVVVKSSSGKTFTSKLGKLNPGAQHRVALKDGEGKHSYEMTIKAVGMSDEQADVEVKFETIRVAPIKIKLDAQAVDALNGRIPFESNRPLDRVEVELVSPQGQSVMTHTQPFDGASGKQELRWSYEGDVGGIKIAAYDVDGFWTSLLLEPWWIEIEHQDIIFDFGKATWQPEEEPKLQKSLEEVNKAMANNAKHRPDMKLYVAGYTDTVGSAADNQRLSGERARAIGLWFQKKGLKVPVLYQGFGEEGQAVKTADNTPEPRNRRAIYVLGNSPPPRSGAIPRNAWRPIK